jgi:hypothetical protein
MRNENNMATKAVTAGRRVFLGLHADFADSHKRGGEKKNAVAQALRFGEPLQRFGAQGKKNRTVVPPYRHIYLKNNIFFVCTDTAVRRYDTLADSGPHPLKTTQRTYAHATVAILVTLCKYYGA